MIRYHVQGGLIAGWQTRVERLTSLTLAPLAGELEVLRVFFARIEEGVAGEGLRFRCRLRGRDRAGRTIDIETLDRDGERALRLALARARREVIRSVNGPRLTQLPRAAAAP